MNISPLHYVWMVYEPAITFKYLFTSHNYLFNTVNNSCFVECFQADLWK